MYSFVLNHRTNQRPYIYYWGNGIVHYYFLYPISCIYMYKERHFSYKHTNNKTKTKRDIVNSSCTIAFSTSFDCWDSSSVGYSTRGTLWLEGIFACFKEIETYIIIIMIIIFNTIHNANLLHANPIYAEWILKFR